MGVRRDFVRSICVGGSLVGATRLGLGLNLPALAADEVQLKPERVVLDSSIEPLVQLIEQTPRDDTLEVMARQVAGGTSYQAVLAALQLAGVRNVQPRPAVGFKFHSVLVVNSAHLASLASPAEDRWLPIFWALDYFKATQNEEREKTSWQMRPVDESRLPRASQAEAQLTQALESWDSEAADAAAAAMARSASAGKLFDLFCRFGARDFRSIGHKAIFVANSFRTLQCIGWQHAEPILRSLAFALTNHNGEPNPAKNDLGPDRPWRSNLGLQSQLRPDWLDGQRSQSATMEMVAAFRNGSEQDAPAAAVDMINRGTSPQSIWDAVLLASGELLMRQPEIVGLHSLTTANALLFESQNCTSDETRRLLLLQACAFVPLFRQAAAARGQLDDRTLETAFEGLDTGQARPDLAEIFEHVSGDRMLASKQLYAYLSSGGSAQDVLDEARRLIFQKGRDAHDYKFSAAVLEDYAHVSPNLRNQFLALSVFNLRGVGHADNRLVSRIRSALSYPLGSPCHARYPPLRSPL